MAIEFNGLSPLNTGSRSKVSDSSTSSRSESTAGQKPAAASTQPETVKLSNQAQTLSKLEENVAQLPDIDEGRIASIKQAIDDGSFTIDPERIAGKLASLEDKLFG